MENPRGSVGQTPHHQLPKTVVSTVSSNSVPVELPTGWREAPLAHPLGFVALGLPSENPSGALTLTLSTVWAPKKIS